MPRSPFTNLIRFQDENLNVWYGNVAESSLDKIEGSTVEVLGQDLHHLQHTDKTAVVKKVSKETWKAQDHCANDAALASRSLTSSSSFYLYRLELCCPCCRGWGESLVLSHVRGPNVK